VDLAEGGNAGIMNLGADNSSGFERRAENTPISFGFGEKKQAWGLKPCFHLVQRRFEGGGGIKNFRMGNNL